MASNLPSPPAVSARAKPMSARPGWNDSFNTTLKGTPAKAPPEPPKVKSEKAYYATPAGKATTAAVKTAGGAAPMVKPSVTKAPPSPVGKPTRSAVGQKFDTAFASARKAGKGTFTFNGKSYNTKVK